MSSENQRFDVLLHETKSRSFILVVIEATIITLIQMTTLVGNGCSVYVFFKNPRLMTIPNYFVIALAVSDVVMALVVMPTAVANLIYSGNVFDNTFCQISGFFFCWMVSGSLMSNTALAVSRYIRLTNFQKYNQIYTPRRVKATIAVIWLVSCCLWIIILSSAGMKIEFYPGRAICFLAVYSKKTGSPFPALFQVVFIFVPSLVMILCYWRVIKEAKRSKIHNISTTNSNVTVKQIKITKSVVALVCGFVGCWIPSSTISHVAFHTDVGREVLMLFTYCSFLSSAINPFILTAANNEYRQSVLRLLQCNKITLSDNST